MRTAICLILLAVVQGCSILHHGIGNDTFPTGYETVCINQLGAAKAGIEKCGSPLKREQAVEVVLHRGTKKHNGMWCWEWTPGYYIAGMTHNGTKVEVGCSPQYKEVNSGVLFHEFGHYWLITNYGIQSHDPKYNSVFHWSGLRSTADAGGARSLVTVDSLNDIEVGGE